MQAAYERTIVGSNGPRNQNFMEGLSMPTDGYDQGYIQEVISGSCELLDRVTSLADKNTLRFAPVRTFTRITASSVFLLKAMGMGVRNGQLRSALDVLHRSVDALNSNVPDDMHLATSFASLLETHIKKLQEGFLLSSRRMLPSRQATRRPSVNGDDSIQLPADDNHPDTGILEPDDWENVLLGLDRSAVNEWFSLPFDLNMAPIGLTGDMNGGLDGGYGYLGSLGEDNLNGV